MRKEINKDFRLAYQIMTDDIRLEKDRMWKLTYYLLLSFACIISLKKMLCVYMYYHTNIRLLLIATVFILLLAGTHHLLAMNNNIWSYRNKLGDLKKNWKSDIFSNDKYFPLDAHNKKVQIYYH